METELSDRKLSRDPLYELEMFRALLDAAEIEGANKDLISGLRREVEWWKRRAVRAVRGLQYSD